MLMAAPSDPSKPKRSLFKKPNWANSEPTSNTSDFFRRSDTYADIVAAKAVKREKIRARREKSHGSDGASREVRRRRISSAEEDSEPEGLEGYDSDGVKAKKKEKVQDKKLENSRIPLAEPTRSPGVVSESLLKPKRTITPELSTVIDLEADSPEPLKSPPIHNGPVRSKRPAEDDDDPMSDEEFPELARKAREKARLKRLGLDKPSTTPEIPSPHSPVRPRNSFTSPNPPPDPVVSILITSTLPNTKPLIVQRKLSQRLRDVRHAWCNRQGLREELTASVFLTWKGKRLFDVTTCKSLGIQLEEDEGDTLDIGKESNPGGGTKRQIHMEAMTEEIFENYRKERERASRSQPDEEEEEESRDEEAAAAAAAVNREEQVRIILNCPGLEEFKLIVKPKTAISKIISTFRAQRSIGPEKTVNLIFDGEKLEPGMTVADSDLNDLDSIDVLVK